MKNEKEILDMIDELKREMVIASGCNDFLLLSYYNGSITALEWLLNQKSYGQLRLDE